MLLAWFCLVAGMLAAYVVLDGFDLGIGALHLRLARTDQERRMLIRSIGPVWNGNEVWLIAGGGTLYFAFPRLYASAFSGFYLPLTIVLWLLIFRGVGLELRMHLQSRVWRDLFDGIFSFSSFLLALMYGAALGNVLRGVPLNSEGYFFLPLWTDWRPGPQPGVLDWYTALAGMTAVAALMLHGALYAALKTTGELNQRARRFAARLWWLVAVLTPVSLLASLAVRPSLLDNYQRYPWLYGIPIVVVLSLIFIRLGNAQSQERKAFLSCSLYLAALLLGAAAAVYPNLLLSTTDPGLNLTVYNAHSGHHALAVGLIWWSLGMAIAIGYFVVIYRMFAGKVSAEAADHGY
jgi:cytochrome d ubiquinol oxidase subunit II